MNFQPWKLALTLKELSDQLKQELPLPKYVVRIAEGVARYEEKLRDLWEEFKKSPTKGNARKLIEFMKENADKIWFETTLEVLGIDELSPDQQTLLETELSKHKGFMEDSLFPDIIKGIESGDLLDNLDYRVIFLYAGGLWSFGFLATVMFDGLDLRDLGDLFIFTGPKDDRNCSDCEERVGKTFTVLQILEENIVPGQLKCLTSCRHMLIPIASPL